MSTVSCVILFFRHQKQHQASCQLSNQTYFVCTKKPSLVFIITQWRYYQRYNFTLHHTGSETLCIVLHIYRFSIISLRARRQLQSWSPHSLIVTMWMRLLAVPLQQLPIKTTPLISHHRLAKQRRQGRTTPSYNNITWLSRSFSLLQVRTLYTVVTLLSLYICHESDSRGYFLIFKH